MGFDINRNLNPKKPYTYKNQKDQIIYLNYQKKKNKINILKKEMSTLLNLVLILETMFGGGDLLQIMF